MPRPLFPADPALRQCLVPEYWELAYVDGSSFSSRDGGWLNAPILGVVSLLVHWPKDRGREDSRIGRAPFYVWPPTMHYPVHTVDAMAEVRLCRRIKFGAWVHPDLMDWALAGCREDEKERFFWSCYYEDGTRYTSDDMEWADLPLDRVITARMRGGPALQQCEYYFWHEGKLWTSNDWRFVLTSACPEIKQGYFI